MPFSLMGFSHGDLLHQVPLDIPVASIHASWWWSKANDRNAQGGCSLHCFEWGEPYASKWAVLQPSINMMGHTAWEAWQSCPILLPSFHGEEESSFPGLVLSNDAVDSESVVGMKPGDSGMVIGYQIVESTHTWLAECFVAQSHIYPSCTGKVSSLNHFPFEPGCEDYFFLEQAVADFEQGLDSILSDCQYTGTWCIFWGACRHSVLSLFRVPTLGWYNFSYI